MNDILAKAEELGKAIAASDRFKAAESARKQIEADQPLQADLKALEEVSRKIATLERDKKPVEPDDKRRARDLQEKIATHPKMQALARTEADLSELMNRINRAIRTPLSG